MRIGIGYDVHQLVEKRDLILGGVKIPFEKGLLGHSDADVLVHSIMDALIGALAMGDIGRHFPDTDAKFKGISSLELLRHVNKMILDNDYKIGNIDSVIICQRPKLIGYMDEMKKNICGILDIEESKMNIKATTEEGLGFTGRGQGIASKAVCILE